MHNLELVSRILENTYSHPSPSGTYSIKHSLQGNRLSLKYVTVVHFASESSLHEQLTRLRDASAQMIDDCISGLKKSYREEADSALKLEDLGGKDDLNLISATSNSPRKIAYFIYNRNFDLDV